MRELIERIEEEAKLKGFYETPEITCLIDAIREMREALQYIACPGKDDADFHELDDFRAKEIAISMANRARDVLAKLGLGEE